MNYVVLNRWRHSVRDNPADFYMDRIAEKGDMFVDKWKEQGLAEDKGTDGSFSCVFALRLALHSPQPFPPQRHSAPQTFLRSRGICALPLINCTVKFL